MGILLHCWWECKLIQPLWKMVWRFLTKLGIKAPYGPAIPLLGIYPKETKIKHVSHCSLQHYLQQLEHGSEVKSLSCVRLFATLWIVAHQDPLSMELSRQEYCSRQPFPSPGDLSDPDIKLRSPALQGDSLPSEPPNVNLKNNTDELIYKTETDPQTQNTKQWLPKGTRRQGKEKLGI